MQGAWIKFSSDSTTFKAWALSWASIVSIGPWPWVIFLSLLYTIHTVHMFLGCFINKMSMTVNRCSRDHSFWVAFLVKTLTGHRNSPEIMLCFICAGLAHLTCLWQETVRIYWILFAESNVRGTNIPITLKGQMMWNTARLSIVKVSMEMYLSLECYILLHSIWGFSITFIYAMVTWFDLSDYFNNLSFIEKLVIQGQNFHSE